MSDNQLKLAIGTRSFGRSVAGPTSPFGRRRGASPIARGVSRRLRSGPRLRRRSACDDAQRHRLGKYLARGWNPLWPVWLALLVLAQALRAWAIASLGRFWNTRIVVVPGFRPVVRGPYRFIRHPNYLAVVIEIFAVSVLCGAYLTALVFSALNAVVLHIRIREEEQALAEVAGADLGALPRFVPARLRRFRS